MRTEPLPELAGHHPGSQVPPGRSCCTSCWDATYALDADAVPSGRVPDLPGRLHELAAQARHDRLTATTDADRRLAAGRLQGLDAARAAWEAFAAGLTAQAARGALRAVQDPDGAA